MYLCGCFQPLRLRFEGSSISAHLQDDGIAIAAHARHFIARSELPGGRRPRLSDGNETVKIRTCRSAFVSYQHNIGMSNSERRSEKEFLVGLNGGLDGMALEQEYPLAAHFELSRTCLHAIALASRLRNRAQQGNSKREYVDRVHVGTWFSAVGESRAGRYSLG